MRIAVLGSGSVGQALASGYLRHGHEVRLGNRAGALEGFEAGTNKEVTEWASLVVLAVLGEAAEELVASLRDELAGKVVIDATNPLKHTPDGPTLFVGFDDSLGERVQRAAPAAKVVKAYNTVGNPLMVDPDLAGGPPTMFLAGEDEEAKQVVIALLAETGWEAADLGGISCSRYLEPMCLAWSYYGIKTGTWGHAFKLLT